MALFFDAGWFDARLEVRGLTRAALAAVGGLTEVELALVFKDQRELSAGQVAAFAELLGVAPTEVAKSAGVATPVPASSPTSLAARIEALERRVAELEDRLRRSGNL